MSTHLSWAAVTALALTVTPFRAAALAAEDVSQLPLGARGRRQARRDG